MIGWHTEVNDSIIQSDVLVHNSALSIAILLLLFLVSTSDLSLLVKHLTTGVSDLERQVRNSLIDTPNLVNDKLNLLSGTSDGSIRNLDCGNDFNNRLFRDFAGELDHVSTDGLANIEHALNSCVGFPSDDEAHLSALLARVMQTSSNSDVLVSLRGIEVTNFNVLLAESSLWVTLRSVQLTITILVCAKIVWIFDELILLRLLFLSLAKTFSFLSLLGCFLSSSGLLLCLLLIVSCSRSTFISCLCLLLSWLSLGFRLLLGSFATFLGASSGCLWLSITPGSADIRGEHADQVVPSSCIGVCSNIRSITCKTSKCFRILLGRSLAAKPLSVL